jgi:hypothetical protein
MYNHTDNNQTAGNKKGINIAVTPIEPKITVMGDLLFGS